VFLAATEGVREKAEWVGDQHILIPSGKGLPNESGISPSATA